MQMLVAAEAVEVRVLHHAAEPTLVTHEAGLLFGDWLVRRIKAIIARQLVKVQLA
jgi:hypothetical protein